MDNSRKCIDRLYKSMDFEAVVGSALKKFGYVYNLDAKSGNFSITAAPGYYILANWKDHVYHIHIQINQSGFSVDSIDASNLLVISPYDVENCKILFDNMIATLQTECAKYESAIKGDKGAKLLKSMINPILRKLKLYGTTLEKCDEQLGTFWLTKKLANNVSLRTRISFGNYEEACYELADAYKAKLLENKINPVLRKLKLSGTALEKCGEQTDQFWLTKRLADNVSLRARISFDNYEEACSKLADTFKEIPEYICNYNGLVYTKNAHYFKSRQLNNIQCRGPIKPLEHPTMVYKTSIKTAEDTRREHSYSVIITSLDRMGYVYFIEGNNHYNAYINKDVILYWNGDVALFKNIVTGEVTDPMPEIFVEDFIYLLEIIALSADYRTGYSGMEWSFFSPTNFFRYIFERILPPSVVFYLDENIVYFGDGKDFYAVKSGKVGYFGVILSIIKMYNLGKPLFEQSKFLGIKFCDMEEVSW